MKEINEIEIKLKCDDLTYVDAFELIKKLPKPWRRKKWKELRESKLESECKNCGSTEKPLVIQHTKHPRDFYVLKNKEFDKLLKNDIKANQAIEKIKNNKAYKLAKEAVALSNFPSYYKVLKPKVLSLDLIENIDNVEYTIRDCCPECKGILTHRHYKKTLSIYKCDNRHEFKTPNKIKYYPQYRLKDENDVKFKLSIELLSQYLKKNDKIVAAIEAKFDNQSGKKALLQLIKEHRIYMEMKHIKTLCKKCAFKEDLAGGKINPAYNKR